MQLYVTQRGQQAGPFPIEAVKQMLDQRELSSTDLVWHEGAPGWMPLSSFMAVREAAGANDSAPPIQRPAPPRAPAAAGVNDAVVRALASVKGLAGMTAEQIQEEVRRGAVFVRYQFCVSVLVMTFKRSSGIYFVKAGHSRVGHGVGYSFISLLCG